MAVAGVGLGCLTENDVEDGEAGKLWWPMLDEGAGGDELAGAAGMGEGPDELELVGGFGEFAGAFEEPEKMSFCAP